MNTIACLGDSTTYNGTLGVRADQFYPHLLSKLLPSGWQCRNFGKSGDSTPLVLARVPDLATWETPEIVVVYAGTNDTNSGHYSTVQASPAPTTTTLAVGTGVGATMPVGSNILVNGKPTRVTAQSGDNLTFVASAAIGTPTAGQTVTPDTKANLASTVGAIRALGCRNVLVVGHPYMNYSSGGDTTSAQQASAATLRALQQGAAVQVGAPYVDLYAFCRDRILAGTDTQGDHLYHVLDSNIHPSPYGSSVWASAIFQAITQNMWLHP